MRVASLGSGSKGNATLVQHGSATLMIDCGFSAKETERRLALLGVDAAELTAILVTHEHGDHIRGVGALSRKYDLPVYCSSGTASGDVLGKIADLQLINLHQSFSIADIEIQPVPVPHDAREPCQFIFHAEQRVLGLLTDLGSISAHVESEYRACETLLLEFNHDLDMLARGPYPPSLKQRVAGNWGHLNNTQAIGFLETLLGDGLQQLIASHISETNNCASVVTSEISPYLEAVDHVTLASQQEGFDWLNV